VTTFLLIEVYLILTGSLQLLTVNLQNICTLKSLSIMNFANLTGPFIKIRMVITLVIITLVITTGRLASIIRMVLSLLILTALSLLILMALSLLILMAFSLLLIMVLSHSSLKSA
jgi:hypothetical protein